MVRKNRCSNLGKRGNGRVYLVLSVVFLVLFLTFGMLYFSGDSGERVGGEDLSLSNSQVNSDSKGVFSLLKDFFVFSSKNDLAVDSVVVDKGVVGNEGFVFGTSAVNDPSVVLSSSVNLNTTDENLSVVVSPADSGSLKNIIDWRRNGSSIMVLNMPFENGTATGTSAEDYSTFGNNGTVTSAIFNATGGFDGRGAYSFDGSTSRIEIPHSSSLNTGSITVAVWFKANSWANARSALVLKDYTGVVPWFLGRQDDVSASKLTWSFYGGAWAGAITTLPSTGVWHQAVGTFDGTNMDLYVDGQFAATYNKGSALSKNTDPVVIGSEIPGWCPGTSCRFNGMIDDVRIYNRSLSSAQILALYQNRSDLIVSSETVVGDVWQACAVPNDGERDGNLTCSNNLTILSTVSTPTVGSIVLNSSSGLNSSSENLSVSVNSLPFGNKHIIDWRRDGSSVMVLNMPFENGTATGTSAEDYSTFGNNGTVVGATFNATGGFDGRGAYSFDGVNDYIEILDDNSLDLTDNFTISAWVMAPIVSAVDTYSNIIFKGSDYWANNNLYGLEFRAAGQIMFTTGDNAGNRDIAGTGLSYAQDGQWYYVVGVRNSTHNILYINGKFISNNLIDFAIPKTADNLQIGVAKISRTDTTFKGFIDEVRIYNRTLSSEQILVLNYSRSDLIVSSETLLGDVWQACVVPNDGTQDGNLTCSNNLSVIVPPNLNAAPNISSVSVKPIIEFNKTVFIQSNVLDNDGFNGLLDVNFTVIAPSGFVFSNVRGVNVSSVWNSTKFNLSESGTYSFNVTATDTGGLSSVSNGEILIPLISLDLSSNPVDVGSVIVSGRLNLSNGSFVSTESVRVFLNGTEQGFGEIPPQDGLNFVRLPGQGLFEAYTNITAGGWVLVVRANNQGDNSLNTVSAYNGIPSPTGNSAKFSHQRIQDLISASTVTNPIKLEFIGAGVSRYIWKECSWNSSVNRNKCASWAVDTDTTTHLTHCGAVDNPSLNNGGGGEWASNSIPWPYQDGTCQLNGGFSTTANGCSAGNGDSFCSPSAWSAKTGIASTGRYKTNIWIKIPLENITTNLTYYAATTNSTGHYSYNLSVLSTVGNYSVVVNSSFDSNLGTGFTQISNTLIVQVFPVINSVLANRSIEFNKQVHLIANITDDNTVWVNFTVKQSDGTIVLNNLNGTRTGNIWRSSGFVLSDFNDYNVSVVVKDSDGNSDSLEDKIRIPLISLDLSSNTVNVDSTVVVSGRLNLSNGSGIGSAVVSVYVNGSLQTGLFGGGGDGSLTVSSRNLVINSYAYMLGNESIGNLSITVNSVDNFVAGDEILIIQMQNSSAGVAGQYEFARIDSILNNDLILTSVLTRSYYSGVFNVSNSLVTQVISVPHYKSLTVNSDASITASDWNGYTGGILVFKAKKNITIFGNISVANKGFRGGQYGATSTINAYQGESLSGKGIISRNSNLGGGGGGEFNTNGGGGGSYASKGTNGGSYDGKWGYAGEVVGSDQLSVLILGSGGGGGGYSNAMGGVGGSGGGIILIYATYIQNQGVITADGSSGGNGLSNGAGGGGGSGGSIYLIGQVINLSSTTQSTGGVGGISPGGYSAGGVGGDGRIRLDANNLSGISTPSSNFNGTLEYGVLTNYHGDYSMEFSVPLIEGNYPVVVNSSFDSVFGNSFSQTNLTLFARYGIFDAPVDSQTSGFLATGSINGSLVDNKDYDLAQFVTFSNQSSGQRLFRVFTYFNDSGTDFSSLVIRFNGNKTVVNNFGLLGGVSSSFSIFVPRGNDLGLTVCPGIEVLSSTIVSCSGGVGFTHADAVAGSSRGGYTVGIDGLDYVVGNLTGTGVGQNVNFNITIWDDTNDGTYGENLTHYIAQSVGFYANWTAGSVPVNTSDGACKIRFNQTSAMGGVLSAFENMTWDSSVNLFVKTKKEFYFGNLEFIVNCTDTSGSFEVVDNYVITNPLKFINRSFDLNLSRGFEYVAISVNNSAINFTVNLTYGNFTDLSIVESGANDPNGVELDPFSFLGSLNPKVKLNIPGSYQFNSSFSMHFSGQNFDNYKFNLTLRLNGSEQELDRIPVNVNLPNIDNYNFSFTPNNLSVVISNKNDASLICSDTKFTITINNTGVGDALITDLSVGEEGGASLQFKPRLTNYVLPIGQNVSFDVYVIVDDTTSSFVSNITITAENITKRILVNYTAVEVAPWTSKLILSDPGMIYEYGPSTIAGAGGAGVLSVVAPNLGQSINYYDEVTLKVEFINLLWAWGHNPYYRLYLNSAPLPWTSNLISSGLYAPGVHDIDYTNSGLSYGSHTLSYLVSGLGTVRAQFVYRHKPATLYYQTYCTDIICQGSSVKETNFTDGLDEDCDGYTDCDDPDSCGSSFCPSGSSYLHDLFCSGTETCNDGVDNNGNGAVDCEDLSYCCTASECSSSVSCRNFVSFKSFCDYGNNETECLVNSSKSVGSGVYGFRNLEIRYPSTLTIYNMTFQVVDDMEVTIGATLNGVGKGYGVDSGPGAGLQGSNGGGIQGGGGSYGGIGSVTTGVGPGIIYGSAIKPYRMGSGGGYNWGGAGGGYLMIKSKTFTNDGSLSLGGYTGYVSYGDVWGAGSGGGIFINSTNVYGFGTYSVKGGDAGNPGGGGRISVWTNNVGELQLNKFNISGGANGYAGSTQANEGTLVFYDKDDDVLYPSQNFRFEVEDFNGTLNYKGVKFWNVSAFLNESLVANVTNWIMDNLSTLTGSSAEFTLDITGVNVTLGSVNVRKLTINANSSMVLKGSTVSVAGRGYLGESGPGAGTPQVAGSADYGGGGSYGGVGGVWGITGTQLERHTYGSALKPNQYGSGGGFTGLAGHGGGSVQITAHNFTNYGVITANGASGLSNGFSSNGGGGAGGSIFINSSIVEGDGNYYATGGGSPGPGGGGGGRISVWADDVSTIDASKYSVKGGVGSVSSSYSSGNGTIVFYDKTTDIIYAGEGFRTETADLLNGQLTGNGFVADNLGELRVGNDTLLNMSSVLSITNTTFTGGNNSLTLESSKITLNDSVMDTNKLSLVYDTLEDEGTSYKSSISNLRLEIGRKAVINFTSPVTNIHNLSRYVNITDNYVSVNTKKVPGLNTSAQLTLKLPQYVGATQPAVLVDFNDDGSFDVCPGSICKVLSWNSGTGVLVFNVTHFTTYQTTASTTLGIWDLNDTEGGGYALYTGDTVRFFANYTNISSSKWAEGGACNVSIFTIPLLDTPMTFNGTGANLWTYDTSAFTTNGTFNWNVTCGGATGLDTLTNADTVFLLQSIVAVPEFGEWALIIAVLGAFLGLAYVRRE